MAAGAQLKTDNSSRGTVVAAILIGVAGLTDEAALVASGNLIVA